MLTNSPSTGRWPDRAEGNGPVTCRSSNTSYSARARSATWVFLRDVFGQPVCSCAKWGVNCVSNTCQPSREPGTGWHRQHRRNGTANQY